MAEREGFEPPVGLTLRLISSQYAKVFPRGAFARREDGIFIEQNKTGKKQVKQWSARLLYVVMCALCLNHKKAYRKEFLLVNKKGQQCKLRTVQDYYLTAKREVDLDDCTLQDIKAKGVSDFEGNLADKQYASGHKTLTETAKYNRKPDLVRAVR